MKKFLKNILWFTILVVALTSALIFFSDYVIRSKSSFKIDKNIHYIVVGHSHPACAFNDSLISNFKNLSSSGESYFYSYFKTKELLRQNPTIHTVFVEFSNNQIGKEMDKWIWDDMYLSARLPIYSSFLTMTDFRLLVKNNFSAFRNAYSLSLKKNLERIARKDYDFTKYGGFRYSTDQKVDSLLSNITMDTTRNLSKQISEDNLEYLSKIIELCRYNKKRIILVRSPLHKKYGGYVNEKQYQLLLTTRFKSVRYIDCSKFPLDNSEFGDLGHLNHKGARRFSIWFQNHVIESLD